MEIKDSGLPEKQEFKSGSAKSLLCGENAIAHKLLLQRAINVEVS
ncbi:MAG: hypothetical protein ACJ8G3_06860 [Burkholderiaceae bacterium]